MPDAPNHVFRTPSRLKRLAELRREDSPTISTIPSLEPVSDFPCICAYNSTSQYLHSQSSSASSATTPSPITPSRYIPHTPTSFSNRPLHSPTHDRTHTERKHDNNPESFIHSWLQNSSAPDTSPPSLNTAYPVIFPSLNSRSPHDLDRIQEGAVRRSLYAPVLPATAFDLFTNDDSGINVPELFQHSPLDLHFDLERSSNVATLEVVSAMRQSLGSLSVPEDFDYDPEIDGTSDDERILRQNTLNPWPYDRQPLYYSGDEHYHLTTVLRPPLLVSAERKHKSFLGRKIKRAASKFLRRTTSFLSKSSKSNKEPRMPNSLVPHPNWGSFKFHSADDALGDDDDDGDVELWLARVVRKNNRVAREGFDTTTGVNRKMAIEEYETCGSWVFQRQWEEYRQEILREREQNMAVVRNAHLGMEDIGPFEREPFGHEKSAASPHLPHTMHDSFTRQPYSHSLSPPIPYRDENLPDGGIGAFPAPATRGAGYSLREAFGRQFRRITVCRPQIAPSTSACPQEADCPQPHSLPLSHASLVANTFVQAFGVRVADHDFVTNSQRCVATRDPSLHDYPPPPSLSSTSDSESNTSYRSFSHYDGIGVGLSGSGYGAYSSESVVIEQGERHVFQIWSPSFG